MAGIRSARTAEGRFVQLANSAGQDPRLSLEARGIIYFILSLPPGRRLTAEWLETQVPNGRRSVRNALDNLENCGYLRRTRRSEGRGRWVWEQVLTDDPACLEQVSPDRIRSHETTCGNTTSSQVSSSDRISPDEKRSDKYVNTGRPNTKHGRVTAVGHRTPVGGRPPESAAKDKTLSEFGRLYRARSDVPDLQPSAKPVAGLCHRCCNGYHPPEECPITQEGTRNDV